MIEGVGGVFILLTLESMVGDRGPVAQATGDRTLMYFFFEICKEVPGPGEGAYCPPNGRQGLSPTPGAIGSSLPI